MNELSSGQMVIASTFFAAVGANALAPTASLNRDLDLGTLYFLDKSDVFENKKWIIFLQIQKCLHSELHLAVPHIGLYEENSAKKGARVPKKKKSPRKYEKPTDYFKDFDKWPQDWIVIDRDETVANSMLALFGPFVEALIQNKLSVKTIKRHMGNLALLGSEIIRRLNDGDEKSRRLKPKQLLLKYIDLEEGPLLYHLDPNDSTDEAHQKSFDATCCKLCRFIVASK